MIGIHASVSFVTIKWPAPPLLDLRDIYTFLEPFKFVFYLKKKFG